MKQYTTPTVTLNVPDMANFIGGHDAIENYVKVTKSEE